MVEILQNFVAFSEYVNFKSESMYWVSLMIAPFKIEHWRKVIEIYQKYMSSTLNIRNFGLFSRCNVQSFVARATLKVFFYKFDEYLNICVIKIRKLTVFTTNFYETDITWVITSTPFFHVFCRVFKLYILWKPFFWSQRWKIWERKGAV